MNSLKKIGAAGLAFLLTLALVLPGLPAAAGFQDAASIDPALADDIELMVALGVFKGDEKGNFNPNEAVTRAQAAKMIYVLKNGGVDDNAAAYAGFSTYSDVKTGFWADGYIHYCTVSGYMDGWTEQGKKVFNPNGQIKGIEMAKLLLCLTGHRSDIQGYTGSKWQSKVALDAAQAGVIAQYTPSLYGATPRQWAARLLTNALNASAVTYNKGAPLYDRLTFGQKTLKLYAVDGELTETAGVRIADPGQSPAKGKVSAGSVCRLNITKDQAGDAAGSAAFHYELPENLLGQQLRIYYRAGAQPGLQNAAKLYAAFVRDEEYDCYTLKLDETKVDGNQISFAGRTITQTGPIVPVDNYRTGATVSNITEANLKELGLGCKDNRTVRLFVKNGQIEKIFFTSPSYAVVRDIDTARFRLELENGGKVASRLYLRADGSLSRDSADRLQFGSAESFARLSFSGALEKGDVAAITPIYTSGELQFKIEKAPVVSGDVSLFKISENAYSSLTINGTAYEVGDNKLEGYTFRYDSSDRTLAKEAKTFYTDGKYLIYAAGEASSQFPKELAYVIATDEGSDSFPYERPASVRLLLPDNTVKTFHYTATDSLPARALRLDSEKSEVALDVVYEYIMEDAQTVSLRPISTINSTAVAGTASEDIACSGYGTGQRFSVNGVSAITDENSVLFIKYGLENKPKYAAIKAKEIRYSINPYENDRTVNGNRGGRQFAYTTVQGLPTLSFGVVKFVEKEYLPSGQTDKLFAVVTGEASIASEEGGRYILSLPIAGPGNLRELRFSVAKGIAEDQMNELNQFRDSLISYETNGQYAVASSLARVSYSIAADKSWAEVAVAGSDNATVYGLDINNNNQQVFFNLTSDTALIVVEAGPKHFSASEDNQIARSEDMTVPTANALIYGVQPRSDGQLEASVIVVETNGASVHPLVDENLRP